MRVQFDRAKVDNHDQLVSDRLRAIQKELNSEKTKNGRRSATLMKTQTAANVKTEKLSKKLASGRRKLERAAPIPL
eukprot:jgi/Tetstr1/443505/TSEL_031509.t1